MSTAIVTGSGGLIGSESVARLVAEGYDVIGIENDTRSVALRPRGLDRPRHRAPAQGASRLPLARPRHPRHRRRSTASSASTPDIELIVHTAAQPSHDWAAGDPHADFGINANGTLNLLQSTRDHCPDATFIFTSTNKVYGDTPNRLPLLDAGKRLELPEDHPYFGGIDTSMSIDSTLHSLFGVSKAAADLLVQEYGRYFDMPTVCFRAGCLTGPNHAGAQLHGFLAYLMKCTVAGEPLHGVRLRGQAGTRQPPQPPTSSTPSSSSTPTRSGRRSTTSAAGARTPARCSRRSTSVSGSPVASSSWELSDESRIGDHRWWISDLDRVRRRLRRLAPAAKTWRRSCGRSTTPTPSAGR